MDFKNAIITILPYGDHVVPVASLQCCGSAAAQQNIPVRERSSGARHDILIAT
jgi:hypothetical protein